MACWRENANTGFVNPYGFVRLSQRDVDRSLADANEEKLTGVIRCFLTTRTPLIIPDFESLPEEQKKKGGAHKCGNSVYEGVPFFRRTKNGLPAIPGSEIRGVIRSAFEALDNCCLSVTDGIASSRSPTPKHPGIIQYDEEGGWTLFEASMKRAKKSRDKSRKKEVLAPNQVKRTWPQVNHDEGQTQNFVLTMRAKVKGLSQEQIRDAVVHYHEIVDITCKNDDLHKQLREEGKLTIIPKADRRTGKMPSGKWPVFYEKVMQKGKVLYLYLSPSQIGRRVFYNHVTKLLGSHAPCKDPKEACEACRLFGMVGEEGAKSSRLRFGDATLAIEDGKTAGDYLRGGYRLRELSSPKPSSVEFYTKRPIDESGRGAAVWTYDTATFEYVPNSNPPQEILRPYSEPSHLEIRGRKFYVHHEVGTSDVQIFKQGQQQEVRIKDTERNMTAEVIKPGSIFTFSVYFDSITEAQLKKLAWTLCLGENCAVGKDDTSSACLQLHKIGHAKPLGFGSIKIGVNSVLLRHVRDGYGIREWNPDIPVVVGLKDDPDERINELLASSPFDKSDPAVRDVMVVTNWKLCEAIDAVVAYPLAIDKEEYEKANSKKDQAKKEKERDKATASYQWFVGNRTMGEAAINELSPSIYRALPQLPTKVANGKGLILPKLIKDGEERASLKLPLDKEATFAPTLGGVPDASKSKSRQKDSTVKLSSKQQKAMRAKGWRIK